MGHAGSFGRYAMEEALGMNYIRKLFTVPASESTLALAVVWMLFNVALMLWALVWQASVIEYQQGILRDLWIGKCFPQLP